MATVDEHYIVPKDVYEHCNKQEDSLQDKLNTLSKRAKRNANRVIEHLKPLTQWDNVSGQFPGHSENIFNYLSYSVRGKPKPEDWESFVPYLITLPPSLFCEKVKREVKLAKRRHGRQVRVESLD